AGAVAGGHDPASQRATARNTAFNERRHNLEEKIGSVFLTCDDTPKMPLCRRNSNAGTEHLSRLFFYVRSGQIPADASGGGTVWSPPGGRRAAESDRRRSQNRPPAANHRGTMDVHVDGRRPDRQSRREIESRSVRIRRRPARAGSAGR